jgi:hypothetical protein
MSPDELAYYRERALIEKCRAAEARVRPAADIHLRLARHYEAVVEAEEQFASTLRIVEVGYPAELDGAKVPLSLDGPIPS